MCVYRFFFNDDCEEFSDSEAQKMRKQPRKKIPWMRAAELPLTTIHFPATEGTRVSCSSQTHYRSKRTGMWTDVSIGRLWTVSESEETKVERSSEDHSAMDDSKLESSEEE